MPRLAEPCLTGERDPLQREQSTQGLVNANQQAIQASLERSKFEMESRLATQIGSLEKEKAVLTRKLDTVKPAAAQEVQDSRAQLEARCAECPDAQLGAEATQCEAALAAHNDALMTMQNCVLDVLQRAQDLHGVTLTWRERLLEAPAHLQRLLEHIHEREVQLEEPVDQQRAKLDPALALRHLQMEARRCCGETTHHAAVQVTLLAGAHCAGNFHVRVLEYANNGDERKIRQWTREKS